ncbi:MAG TPA: methyl-accepting chemotaxis protein [Rhodopila sp.]|nr:methyl-accepting chemotaxis protein [Rhodopila sp.]
MRDDDRITSKEVPLPEGTLLVSQTDTGGRITFANDAFVAISGFSLDELIGAPHNLVRHPHMPKAAFRDLWTTVKSGQPWEGLVKNRTKGGDYYWVRANVTPVVEDGKLTGYISIRTKPERDEVGAAETVYEALRTGRRRDLRIRGGAVVRTGVAAFGRRMTAGIISGTALNFAIIYAAVAASLAAGVAGVGAGPRSLMLLCVGVLVAAVGAMAARRMGRAFVGIEGQFGALARGDLKRSIDSVPVPELQTISRLLRALRAKLAYAEEVRVQRERDASQTRIDALRDVADKVEATANQTAETVAATAAAMEDNAAQMTGAAAAVNENAAAAAHAAGEALASTQTVAAAAEQLAASIGEITNQVVTASRITREAVTDSAAAERTISALQTEVERIGQIASLIANIASQTNLLALNATIEAARAGESGRGFAVVASEVKKLAAETARATENIGHQIEQIRQATTQTVGAVTRIAGQVGAIDEVSSAIAAAMEEQSAATQEISRSVAHAAQAAQSVTEVMASVAAHASQTSTRADRVRNDAVELAAEADQSRHALVRTVRTSIADAERRMHDRAGGDGLRTGGQWTSAQGASEGHFARRRPRQRDH